MRAQATAQTAGAQTSEALEQALTGAIVDAGLGGRIDYARDDCSAYAGGPIPLPPDAPQPVPAGVKGVAAVRAILAGAQDVESIQQSHGLIRIRFRGASPLLRQTKIAHFAPDEYALYMPERALTALLDTTELRQSLENSHLQRSDVVGSMLLIRPDPQQPHLPTSINQQLADRIVDRIARTFGATVLFGVCSKPAIFSLHTD